mmetsp:Transcript_50278/g.103465  ORF Transcript_50278/g.103465 Transcript_50278/m.103465 type:complete len:95 (+) Transcript_50278:1516-1800(+)
MAGALYFSRASLKENGDRVDFSALGCISTIEAICISRRQRASCPKHIITISFSRTEHGYPSANIRILVRSRILRTVEMPIVNQEIARKSISAMS